MAVTNLGNQRIGWKYMTPLKADYLNTILGGLVIPGLITEPEITFDNSHIIIQPFSAAVHPIVNGTVQTNKLVKIDFSEAISFSTINSEYAAIGVKFTFLNNSENYADIEWVTSDWENYNGIFIATSRYDGTTGDRYISTSGADFSELLLEKKGFNPKLWVTSTSPRRWSNDNSIEVRTNNNLAIDNFIIKANYEEIERTVNIDPDATYKSSSKYFVTLNDTGLNFREMNLIGGNKSSISLPESEDVPSSVGVFKGRLYVGISNQNSVYKGLWILNYDGSGFTQITSIPTTDYVRCIHEYKGRLYIGTGTGTYSNDGLYVSTDGSLFEKVTGIYANEAITDICEYNGQLYVSANTSQGLAFSSDGISFTQLNINYVNALCSFDNHLYIGTSNNGLSRSAATQSGFEKITDSASETIYSLCPLDDKLYVGTSGGLAYYDGTTYSKFPNNVFPTNKTVCKLCEFNKILYIGVNNGLIVSHDGEKFSNVSNEVNNKTTNSFCVYDDKLFIASLNNVVYTISPVNLDGKVLGKVDITAFNNLTKHFANALKIESVEQIDPVISVSKDGDTDYDYVLEIN